MDQTLLFTNSITTAIEGLVAGMAPATIHVVTDSIVAAKVLPALGWKWPVITVPDGDLNKDLESLSAIWRGLIAQEATRRSLVICLGGGVVSDMGGFAAATFKRGVRFINVPTTLLSAVDAAVGGKTGINFDGLKNEVGAFAPADAVVISTSTFGTLPPSEITSGYAEMLKHGLLSGPGEFAELLAFDPVAGDPDTLLRLLEKSVRVKERIVTEDPVEQGIRRTLNLGHTAGHAFESLALERGEHLAHGHAVAAGIAVELVLSHMLKGFPSAILHQYVDYLRGHGYPVPHFDCDDYPRLLALMAHDKKNDTPGAINFTLLTAPGSPQIDCIVPTPEITAALDIYRDLVGM